MFRYLRRQRRRRLNITIAGATHQGKQRDHNEDAFVVVPQQLGAVVADGMGGLARGEVASRMVVDILAESLQQGRNGGEALQEAHRRIREASMSSVERMGSTAVVLKVDGGTATLHWVGDSRGYLWRGGQLKQLTKDHSFVEELIDAGAISAHEAETHPNRNVLTRAVGIRDTVELKIDSTRIDLQPGDCLLLCTDGLHGYLPQPSIIECLARGGSAEAIVQRLIERTLRDSDAGDNVTAVCAIVED
ncbi:PP2C family protein-serine/threonine phosphatase [Sinimarinibacterium thermocellulolyticum]|uniref:Protein phosphatase 2C domain-containing protein n=1 Tax=Sinimarinibacterium thermocellulolyticum TaxID=3170016 RepID=A0ABV2A6A8_9GAMM